MSAAAAGTTAHEETGAGGKFRRKPFRKSQATPYDRPPIAVRNTSSNSGGGGGYGWLSKIIDPASKLINASAHRLFGLAFRKRLLPPPQQQQMPPPAASQDVSGLNRITDSVPRSEIQFKVGGQSGTDHPTREHVSLDNGGRNQGISELEKMLAQKTFTESEINRLTALLNSRTVEDNGKIELEDRLPKTIFEEGNSSEFKSPLVPDSYNGIRYPGVTSSLFSNAKATDDETATPAELAKAYMGSRPSKVSPSMLGSRIQAIKNDLPLINSVVFSSQSPFFNSANKSLSRVSAHENGHKTPLSRGRSAIYSMSRTPYSRAQKSTDVRGVNSYNSPHIPLEMSTSRQTALKRRSNVLDDDIASAGPIRRIRHRPSLLSSKRSNQPAGGSSPTNEVLSIYRSKNAQSRTPDENFKSVPSQSSVVAQKILQQLDKLSPSPKEKSSEHKSAVSPGKSAFTLTPDMLFGQALRNFEKAESSKIIDSSQENNKVNASVQRVATNEEFTVLNGQRLEENGPKKPTSASKSKSESAFNSREHRLAENEQAFQLRAHEDNNPETKSDQNGTVPNGSIIYGKEGKVSYSSGSPTNPIQPTAMDNVSTPLFGKVSLDEQTTMIPHLGHGTKLADKFSPSTFTSSSPTDNDSQARQTSALPESMTPYSSGNDSLKTNHGDSKGTQGAGAVDARPSTASNGISTTAAYFSSNAFGNNGFANSSFSVQPALSQFSGTGAQNVNSLTSTAAASVPSAATGITSSGINLFSTSVAPFSVSPMFGNSLRKDTQSSSDVVAEKPVTAMNNRTSNTFASDDRSSAKVNGSNVFSGIGSSESSPKMDNQGLDSVSNADSNHAKTATPAAESIPQNTLFKFGSSGFSSAPTFLSGTTNFAPKNSMTSLPAPMFGQNSLASSKEAGPVGSNGGTSNSLFGSNWNSDSTPLFGSTTSSLMVPPSVFQFGSSASSSAPISSSSTSTPGFLFGSSSATFSFTSADSSGSPSLFSASQPVTGTTEPAFTFASSASPLNINNNNQTSMEDTMTEDTVQTTAPTTSAFGQLQSSSNSVFTFGSPSPSVTPGTGVFQFGGQPCPVSSLNQTPFQAPGSFNASGGFSIGTTGESGSFNAGGGFSLGRDDKSARKIVKVKKNPKRR